MQEELHKFERNKVWNLVPQPADQTIITRWVFRNKLDEFGSTTRNKARLVIQGYNHEEWIDYDETFAPVARMEAIRIFIAFASHMEFTLFQMNVKSVFPNGFLKEEVYVKQSHGFENHEHDGRIKFLPGTSGEAISKENTDKSAEVHQITAEKIRHGSIKSY
ncbi:putative mitochondrial protein AtMg00820 [Nicotiana tabacum]|uniref:Mitochondrial protein AtMg00820 n=1 Tax=Nicotiana tabacum TaxID=4097 RepID=A0AC58UC06_TOBAC|nr:uncharacterized mitochondrial protein AtMg00820-like [Nicotiana tomentosiformis]